jgi:hypothetical protein
MKNDYYQSFTRPVFLGNITFFVRIFNKKATCRRMGHQPLYNGRRDGQAICYSNSASKRKKKAKTHIYYCAAVFFCFSQTGL